MALGKHDKTDAPGEGAHCSPSPEKHPEPDYSLSGATGGESAPDDPLIHVTRGSIQQAGYQVLGNDPKWPGLSETGQMAFAIGSRCAARFPFTLGERRTRRNDLWYRFLSLAAGGQTMPDDEFVEMVLYTTGRIKDCSSLAKKLLGRFQSLAGVFNAELYQLADLGPIDQDIYNAFRAVRGVAGHLARQEIGEKPVIANWDKLLVYLRTTMAHKKIEQFRALFLDRSNVLLADEMQNEGTIDHTPVYPREVVKRALILDATAVIMVHNHPSNRLDPSDADIEMTRRIKDALDAVGMVLHDHVIISKAGHTSFRILGLL
jgi:DNA repair protein RadC